MKVERPALATVLTALVVVAVVAAHVNFVAMDARLPRDLGLYYRDLPAIDDALHDGDVGSLLGFAAQSGGWYPVVIGTWLALVGPSPGAFRAFDVLWVGLVVAGTALLARRLSARPDVAGFAAAALVGASSMVVVAGRTGWIHLPEAALAIGTLLAIPPAGAAPSRARTAAVAVLGALALALRPSGLVWIALLAPLVPARIPARADRLAIAIAWGIGVLVHATTLGPYLATKLEARARYAAKMPGLLTQLVQQGTGAPVLVVGLVGLILAWPMRDRAEARVLAAWLLVPVVLVGIFQAGIDNFTLLAPALAALAAVGYAARWPRGAALAGIAFAVGFVLQFVPVGAPWLSQLGISSMPGPKNYVMPYQQPGDRDVLALLAAICPDAPARCDVAVDQGLFQPYSEDPGALELYLGGWQRARIHSLTLRPVPSNIELAALVSYGCGGEADQQWRNRYVGSEERFDALARSAGMQVAFEGPPTRFTAKATCQRKWFTPGGEVQHPDALPEQRPAPPERRPPR